VIEMAQSGLNATALRRKDYFRANVSFQRKFKKLSYFIPFRYMASTCTMRTNKNIE
jgi:hypothetical protein